jgi:hypothetical protein
LILYLVRYWFHWFYLFVTIMYDIHTWIVLGTMKWN